MPVNKPILKVHSFGCCRNFTYTCNDKKSNT